MLKLLRLKLVELDPDMLVSHGQICIEGREALGPMNLHAIVEVQRENAEAIESEINALQSSYAEILEWRKAMGEWNEAMKEWRKSHT